MDAIYITESDVAALVTIEDAIAALDECFADWPQSGKGNLPRGRVRQANGSFNLLGGSYALRHVFGLKAYFAAPGGTRFHVMLYSSETGGLVAMIEANLMGQLRTGAASGVATRILARDDASTLAVIGTGRQAFAQIAAVTSVRPIRAIRVFSRTPERRSAFATRVEKELGIETTPVETSEACVSDADVVVTITKSSVPVFNGDWLSEGTHVNAAGANSVNRRELDRTTIQRADVRTTDSLAQARMEAGEYAELVAAGLLEWTHVRELGDIAAGLVPGRQSPKQITLFKSLGIGIEDIAFAERVYQRAKASGAGRRMLV